MPSKETQQQERTGWFSRSRQILLPENSVPILDSHDRPAALETVYGEVPKNTIMEAHHVTVHYDGGAKLALFDVSFPIAQGKITALMGPSGCGKSTILRCFNRMNDADVSPNTLMSGSVLFGGKDIGIYDPDSVRSVIGMVAQQPDLFPDKTIMENAIYGLRRQGINDPDQLHAAARTSLEMAGLLSEVGEAGMNKLAANLSGGQKQRLGIARALAVKPDVLLMDEPTSALDPRAAEIITKLMRKLSRDYGQTIVWVTHQLELTRIADFAAFFAPRYQHLPGQTDVAQWGMLVEYGKSNDRDQLFDGKPKHPETREYLKLGLR